MTLRPKTRRRQRNVTLMLTIAGVAACVTLVFCVATGMSVASYMQPSSTASAALPVTTETPRPTVSVPPRTASPVAPTSTTSTPVAATPAASNTPARTASPANGSPTTPARTPTTTNGIVTTVTNPGDLLVLVNKTRALPNSYAPPDLINASSVMPTRGTQRIRQLIADPLKRMYDAMRTEGLSPEIVSGFRSYTEQQSTYAYWVGQYGEAQASMISARAGHSEHQLGTTVDFGSPQTGFTLEESFADTPEGRWLAVNSPKYGFLMSYPSGKIDVTGYSYEPWHFRYVGDTAPQIFAGGPTLEEYLRKNNRLP